MPASKFVRVAVDIGGTFTDLQIHNERTGSVHAYKTPTTPADPSEGLLIGLNAAAERYSFRLSDIRLIMHGSTIATNAVLERKLPTGALITTAGFEDVLEIGRHIRKNVYSLKAEDRALLIPREMRFGIAERVRADGAIEKGVDENTIAALADRLDNLGVEAVAVAFLHAYRNPHNENLVAASLAKLLPDVSVATSFNSSPEIREYERTSTTVLNALLKPVISGYLQRVEQRLADAGIDAQLYMVQSNGGVALPEEAARMPVKLLLSGPAGGAMAVGDIARRYACDNLVGFDMGGTSSDVSVVIDGAIGETAETDIDGLPVRLPMIEIRTIGAGGGSIARTEANALRVGPESAGADPGPACYGKGGTWPTVTDANAVLGRLAPSAFMGGGMALDIKRAEIAIDERVAAPLALTREAACAGVVAVADTHMAGAIRLSLFEKGADPAEFVLTPFGGAAGLHACAVAEELDMDRILFPADASTLSARGILHTDLRRDLSRSELMIADASNLPRIASLIQSLQDEAAAMMAVDGLARDKQRITFFGDLRYRGQAYEVTTPWPDLTSAQDVNEAALADLLARFHDLHLARFAHSAPDDAVELVTLRAVATGLLERPDVEHTIAPTPATRENGTRLIYIDGDWLNAPVYRRNAVIAGAVNKGNPIIGPAIIEEDYTVLLIAPGWRLTSAKGGDLLASRDGATSS